MSTRKLVGLATESVNNEDFTLKLLEFIFELVDDLIEICDQNKVRLESIPAFASHTNDWQSAIL